MTAAHRGVGLLLVAAAGCTDPGPTASELLEADVREYEALVVTLAAARQPFLPAVADALTARETRVYWLDTSALAPTLHSARSDGGGQVDYDFALSGTDGWRASGTMVVTVEIGSMITYRAWDAADPARSLGDVALPGPTGGQRYWAYAVDGEVVYVATTGGVAGATLWRWRPGGALESVLDLAASGLTDGYLGDVFASDGTVLLIEGGRLWTIDPSAGTARWAGNRTAITGGVSIDDSGLLYAAADGLWFQRGTEPPVDVGAAIAASPYRLNHAYAEMHHYFSDGVLCHGRVVYIGQNGLFSFDLATSAVTPLALEPRLGTRIEYIDPQVLADGTILVTGLESESGSVGYDGPVWALHLP